MRIAYGEEQYSGQAVKVTVPLREHGWYHVRSDIGDIPTRLKRTEFRGDPVTRTQMMRVLADLKYLMIRAQYHSEQIEGRCVNQALSLLLNPSKSVDSKFCLDAKYKSYLLFFSLQSAVLQTGKASSDGEADGLVETCECPEGYAGLSCEECAWGYAKITTNGSDHQDHHVCVKCDCNGHAGSCDLLMGECMVSPDQFILTNDARAST